MMDMTSKKDRESTELRLLDAVGELVEQDGFENLGINAVAQRAGVSKVLIYRYFESLEGLISAYIRRHDFWINFDRQLPAPQEIGSFAKQVFREQIRRLRENYTLRRLYRWELTSDNALIRQLREERERKGVWLTETFARLSGRPFQEVAVPAALLSSAISYLVLLEENCEQYNGIALQQEAGWRELEQGIDRLIDTLLTNR